MSDERFDMAAIADDLPIASLGRAPFAVLLIIGWRLASPEPKNGLWRRADAFCTEGVQADGHDRVVDLAAQLFVASGGRQLARKGLGR